MKRTRTPMQSYFISEGWTVDDIAEKTELSRPTVIKILGGKWQNCRLDIIMKFCQGMGITPLALFSETDSGWLNGNFLETKGKKK